MHLQLYMYMSINICIYIYISVYVRVHIDLYRLIEIPRDSIGLPICSCGKKKNNKHYLDMLPEFCALESQQCRHSLLW